jgi:hypothetical protein
VRLGPTRAEGRIPRCRHGAWPHRFDYASACSAVEARRFQDDSLRHVAQSPTGPRMRPKHFVTMAGRTGDLWRREAAPLGIARLGAQETLHQAGGCLWGVSGLHGSRDWPRRPSRRRPRRVEQHADHLRQRRQRCERRRHGQWHAERVHLSLRFAVQVRRHDRQAGLQTWSTLVASANQTKTEARKDWKPAR